MGGCRPERNIADPRNTWMEENSEKTDKWRHILREARAQKGM